MNKQIINKQDILDASRIGFEIEFYSKLKPIQIARLLSNEIETRVALPYNVDEFNKKKLKYHTAVEPTANIFKLEIDNSGGKDMKELITGPLAYNDAKRILIKTLNWIEKNGWTNERTSIHLNISFNEYKIKMPIKLSKLHKINFLLDIDENFIYSKFPERKNNVYARSIKDIFIFNTFYSVKNPSILPSIFKVPNVKYYGINFLKLPKEYLEIRYLGGKNYHKKIKEILEINDYLILTLYNCLFKNILTKENTKKLNEITKNIKILNCSYNKPENFKLYFPKIKVYSDLQYHEEILKSQWLNFRDKLFELIIKGKLEEGNFNFDSDLNKYQLKNGKINGVDLNGFEFFNCEVSGHLENCEFFDCKLNNAIITNSIFSSNNEIINSKIEESPLFSSNTVENSFINNKKLVINCKVKDGVIRSGIKGNFAKISNSTEIIEFE